MNQYDSEAVMFDPQDAVLVLERRTGVCGRAIRRDRHDERGGTVFATGMTGYQETLTDPSYDRQIVGQRRSRTSGTRGSTGTDPESSRIWVAGDAVRDPSPNVSNSARHRQP